MAPGFFYAHESWAADVLVCPLEIPIPIPNPAAAGLSPAAPMELAKWLGEAIWLEAIGRRRSKAHHGRRSRPAGEYIKALFRDEGGFFYCFIRSETILFSHKLELISKGVEIHKKVA